MREKMLVTQALDERDLLVKKIWGISQRRVAILCKEGRVPGAELVGNRWFLPSDAVKPQDPRKAKKD